MPEDWFKQFESPKEDYFSQFEEVPKTPEVPKEKSLFDKAWDVGKELVNEGEQYAQEFPSAHPTITKLGKRFLSGPSEEDLGGVKLNVPSTSPGEIPGINKGISGLSNALINQGNYASGYAGGLLKEWMPGIIENAFDPGNAGIRTPFSQVRNQGVKQQRLLGPGKYNVSPEGTAGVHTPTDIPSFSARERLKGAFHHEPTNSEGVVTVKADKKLEPQIKEAEIVSEIPNSVPSEIPEVKLRGPAQEYIDAVKSGKIDRSVSFSDFTKNKESLMSRFVKEEKGTFSPFEMFKKIKGVDPNEANKVRESIIDTLIQGGRLDLEGIYGKSVGMKRNQFNKIVDEIIDTGAAGKIAEQIKINTPEPIQRLLGALSESKVNSALQAAQLSAERGQRFGAFSSTLKGGEGKEGFFNAASKMSGEYGKVSPTELKLGQSDTDALFDQIKNNTRITSAEKLRAGFALRDLLDGTRTLQRNELQLMDRIYGPGVGNQIMMMHGGLGGVGIKIAKTANTMKSAMASLDLSAPFRQGLGLVHRKEFRDAFMQMYKYAGSHDSFMALENAIESHPNYLLSRDSGLFIADHEMGNYEEQFMNSYINNVRTAGKVGKIITEPFAASERAYVGFLNKLRFDTFNSLLEKANKTGLKTFEMSKGEKVPTDLTRKISQYVNTSTGRGNLGRFNKISEELNVALFSPKLIASRLQILNPKYYIDQPAFVRKEALKTLFAMAGFTVTASGIGSILGGQTKLTPSKENLTNPDYGKIKWNNTRLDPGGGLNQYIVAASQFLTGQSTSSTSGKTYDSGQFGQPGRVGKLIGLGNPRANSFLENKMSPMASLIDTIISGKIDPATRKPYNIPIEIRKRFVPLMMQDMIDLYKSDPSLLPLGIPASMGMGLQTYQQPGPSMGLTAPSMGNLKP